MTTEQDQYAQRQGEALAKRLRLGEQYRKQPFRIMNEEWLEADRLGRLLLGAFDAQDARKRGINNEGENNV